ncbi:Hypothetical protein SMAX5B_017636 [Scophthalmus maximus]|uniref:Uncharacterized protein n=1 Tax=Scophthalmus maximus TaxID=52904 RepID=A0A2U9C650_SCOMX|nr:Hypothetical protein SMAX5B_017636 [Scophthalmus maximus]
MGSSHHTSFTLRGRAGHTDGRSHLSHEGLHPQMVVQMAPSRFRPCHAQGTAIFCLADDLPKAMNLQKYSVLAVSSAVSNPPSHRPHGALTQPPLPVASSGHPGHGPTIPIHPSCMHHNSARTWLTETRPLADA